MSNIFFDRYGRKKYAGDDVIPMHQKGYFAILVWDNKVLLTYPPLVKVPEFPGGTVDRKEDFRDCLYRKLYEETGIDFMLDYGEKDFLQTINYYAGDAKPKGVFCIYEQRFILYDASSYGFHSSDEKWKTPENGFAAWVKIEDIIAGTTKINYTHWLALKEMYKS